MGHIRAFVDADIPQVSRLHGVVFRTGDRTDREGRDPYHAYFKRVFLDNPSRDDALPSLVYQEDDGRVVGFLGVVPRRMSMGGQQLQAAISSQFIVDPRSRSALARHEKPLTAFTRLWAPASRAASGAVK